MPSEVKVRAPVQRRLKEKRKPKTVKETEDQEKFNQILDRCLGVLFNTMENGGDVFELLDPLISDTQCHMHSLLILSILHKCYNRYESVYDGLELLQDKDKMILSYAVLFSLLKTVHKDKLGILIHEVSLQNFDCLILPSRKREHYCIIDAKKKFNSYSVEYIKSVASKNTKEILNECHSPSINLQLQFLPCYVSVYSVVDFIRQSKLPIIVTLININIQKLDDNIIYSIHNNAVGFYQTRDDGNQFFYKKDLSDFEKNIPTITFGCYRLISDDNAREFRMDCDIEDFLMLDAACHIQLPINATLPDDYQNGEEYVRNLYKINANISSEYDRHYELGRKYNLIESRYSKIVQTSLEQEGEKISITIERREEDSFFVVDHIYLSSYSRECHNLRSFDVTAKLYQREIFSSNRKNATLEALRKLVV